jgi:drug/metabolite transporter (DMT)-like permease
MIGVYPVVTALISVLAFGERLGAVRIAGVVLATVGVVLIGAGS